MNRLAEATSLYLRQHADNPVHWQPWDPAALAEARQNRRPILLSIGYSACHWCHVMAHESFEDEATARVMNELYVNIKVDREERPDLDRVYQLAHQLISGRGGGWPLTVFLEPDGLTPFFAGTYFPPRPRHGLPAFADLLRRVRAWYDDHPGEVVEQARGLTEAIAALQSTAAAGDPPGPELLVSAAGRLGAHYDDRHGGFGAAPKFPQAPLLALLATLAEAVPEAGIASPGGMLRDALTRMALSGLRDHLDGGFFRYTVDAAWTIPHFEKMLYDNAMLLPLYAEGGQLWRDEFLRRTAEGIAGWLETAMRDDNGGYYASIDADADGREGGFHTWQPDEVAAILEADEYTQVAHLYGLRSAPNFEGHAWHLLRHDGDPAAKVPEAALLKLRRARAARVPPATDTKQLTSWNALCIQGLTRAGMALDRPEWVALAGAALDFITERVWVDGRLFAVFAGGRAQFPAYLDDHAGLLDAVLFLLQARWRDSDYRLALALGERLLAEFHDPEGGGFWFTATGSEAPIQRLRPLQDDALPSGNGVAARALLRLGHLAGETRFLDAAGSALAAGSRELRDHPLAHAALLCALHEYHDPAPQVIITGPDEALAAALCRVARSSGPGLRAARCFRIERGTPPGALQAVQGGLETAAYVCQGLRCLPPVHAPERLAAVLKEARPP